MTTPFRPLDYTTTTTMEVKDQGLTKELKDLGKMMAMEAALTMELRARTLGTMTLLRSYRPLRKPGKYMMSFDLRRLCSRACFHCGLFIRSTFHRALVGRVVGEDDVEEESVVEASTSSFLLVPVFRGFS